MPTDLEEMITQHFGVSAEQLSSALDTLAPIRPEAASLSDDEAALFDEVDFAEDEQAYARVTLEAAGHTARLIGTAYSANEVAELLGVRDSRVRQRRADRTLWAIEDCVAAGSFPRCQFENTDAAASDPPSRPGAARHPHRHASACRSAVADHRATRPGSSTADPCRRCSGCATEATFGWSARSLKPPPGPVGDCRADTARSAVHRRATQDRDTPYRVTDGPQIEYSGGGCIARKAIMSWRGTNFGPMGRSCGSLSAPRTRG